ncbi:hypothetical protein ABZ078_12610 [Streptomyces sp. NPDC006385]|uniref:hypothetical protein n=1 Tax=Streptomyces sp. NPDC006385 TaxID=3156761 RepID=UPI0033BC9CD5
MGGIDVDTQRQRIEAQRLTLDAYEAVPYVTHLDFRTRRRSLAEARIPCVPFEYAQAGRLGVVPPPVAGECLRLHRTPDGESL